MLDFLTIHGTGVAHVLTIFALLLSILLLVEIRAELRRWYDEDHPRPTYDGVRKKRG